MKTALPSLNVIAKPEAPLVLTANNALRRHLARECKNWQDREDVIRECILDSSGLDLSDGDHLYVGLTSAPVILAGSWEYNGALRMDEPTEGSFVWWFADYAIRDFTEDLKNFGRTEFQWGFVCELAS